MKIEGANFGNYDAQHLSIVRRETAQTIKPNLFREVDEDVAKALIFTDVVNLSPEARELLKKLRKQMSGKGSDVASNEDSIQELIYNLRQLRDLVYGEEKQGEEEAAGGVNGKQHEKQHQHDGRPIMLSGPQRDEMPRPRSARPGGHLREVVEKMIRYCSSDVARDAVKDELVVLGEKMLSEVAGFKVNVIVLEPNRPLTAIRLAGMMVVASGEKTFDGRPWESVRGLYDQSRRLLVLGQEVLGLPRSAARHEFAHAFDHTFQERNKRLQPLSVQLWNLFAAQRKGVVTDYARTNPQEWFAETVEAFFRPGGREKVRDLDPQMFQYLQTLFAS